MERKMEEMRRQPEVTGDNPETGSRVQYPEIMEISGDSPETGAEKEKDGRAAEWQKDGMAAEQPEEGAEKTQEKTRASKEAKREAKRRAVIEEIISWIKSFAIMFCVALFLTNFIIINAVIPSGSMEDTIMTHDRLIGARFSYWFSEPERGDIVIFHYPVDEKKIYIKRIIGLPGETVRIENSGIYIDDSTEPLQEGYLKEEWDVLNDGFEFHVPEGCYLMLGDNRNWSEDARYWADNAVEEGLADNHQEAEKYAFVEKKKILGKAIFTYFSKFRILVHGEWYAGM